MSCKYWNDPDKGNVNQDNNSCEALITKSINSLGKVEFKPIYRETCGPSALESILESLGVNQSQCGIIQPSDYYAMAMNDKKLIGQEYFDMPVNRYLEAYPLVISIMYPLLKSRVMPLSKGALILSLSAENTGCIINLKNPGHFIAGLHISKDGIVYYNDSWLGNFWNPDSTHKRSIHIDKLFENMKNGYVEVSL